MTVYSEANVFLAVLKITISHYSWKKDEREKRPNKHAV